MLTKLANCGRNRANVCRNLHALIHKTGLTLNVETSVVEDTPVVVMCGKPGVRRVNFPCLHLSSWAKALFKRGERLCLAASHWIKKRGSESCLQISGANSSVPGPRWPRNCPGLMEMDPSLFLRQFMATKDEERHVNQL